MAGRRGVALIFVLMLMVALGLVAAEVGRDIRTEAAFTTNLRARTVARYAAESGVEAALARFEMLLDSATTPAEQVALFRDLRGQLAPLQDVAVGDGRFEVAAVDLNARIDLNRTDAGSLERFLRQFANGDQARQIVTALRKQPLARIGELADVPGVGDALALRLAPYVTVWGDGLINLNTAPESVLAALPGIDADVARGAIQRRDAGEAMAATALGPAGAPVPSRLVTATPKRLLIVARGWMAGLPLTHEVQAVYAISGHHLELQAWQERDL
jgi:general secretion pathway protein K